MFEFEISKILNKFSISLKYLDRAYDFKGTKTTFYLFGMNDLRLNLIGDKNVFE